MSISCLLHIYILHRILSLPTESEIVVLDFNGIIYFTLYYCVAVVLIVGHMAHGGGGG